MNCFLGIDTSCYTTSVAILDEEARLVADARKLLVVKSGGRGLAQSEMVFQHTRNLPGLIEQALMQADRPLKFKAIGVSAQPRTLPDSYMPAFLVGAGAARILALTHGVPLEQTSHQENHIWAGIWSAGGPIGNHFIALHLSGGTTEVVEVQRNDAKLDIRLLGGSQDLHAGQFIDRVGVALGLPFPAGPHLEKLAAGASKMLSIPVAVKGLTVSFAGPESHAQRLIQNGDDSGAIAAGVQHSIAESVAKIIEKTLDATGASELLLVGGVTANGYLRSHVERRLSQRRVNIFIPQPYYSADNAVGNAFLAFNLSNKLGVGRI